MKYNIWTESSENSWNGTDTNTTDAHIQNVWSDCMETLDEGDDTEFIRHAIDESQIHAKTASLVKNMKWKSNKMNMFILK